MASYRTSALLHLINPKYGDTLPAVVHFQTSCSIGEWMVKDDSFGRQSPSHPSHTHRAVGMYGCYLRSVPYLPYRALCTPTPSRALNHTHLTALHLHLHHTYPPPPSPFSTAHTLSACSPFAHCSVCCALSLSFSSHTCCAAPYRAIVEGALHLFLALACAIMSVVCISL